MMTDATESAVQRIARDRNGEVTPKQLFDLIIAVNTDAEARNEQMVAVFQQHCEESQAQREELDARVATIEGWQHKTEEECYERVLRLIHEEHEQRHNAYIASLGEEIPGASPQRRRSDPEGADHSGERDTQARQVWLMWLIGSKVGYIILTVLVALVVTLVNLALNWVWHGAPGS